MIFATAATAAVLVVSTGVAHAELVFKSAGYPAKVTAKQSTNQVFQTKTTAGSEAGFVCSQATMTSNPNLAKAEAALMVDPSYGGCEYGGLPATVDASTGGCSFILYAEGDFDLSCQTGKGLLLTVWLNEPHTIKACTIRVTPTLDTTSTTGQLDGEVGEGGRTSSKRASSNANVTGGKVEVTFEATGLKYHTEGTFCPEESETLANGKYLGSVKAEGSQGAIMVGEPTEEEEVSGEFTSVEYPTTISGSTESAHVFGFGEGLEFSCTENSFTTNELGEAIDRLTVAASYTGCEFAGLPATFDFKECDYVFYADEKMDLSCPTGNREEIRIFLDSEHTSPICTIAILPTLDTKEPGVPDGEVGEAGRTRSKLTGIEYVNNENGTITINTAIEGIAFEYTGALCPDEEGKVFENATYSGSVTVAGTNGAIDVM
jgi:hypothetical protein